jgi:hypothetical protein
VKIDLEPCKPVKPSKAVIANGNHGGCVLFYAGPVLEGMNDAGLMHLADLGLDDAPHGISVWEGDLRTTHTNTPDANEYDAILVGKFRAPTGAEWEAIHANRCPWEATDWDVPDALEGFDASSAIEALVSSVAASIEAESTGALEAPAKLSCGEAERLKAALRKIAAIENKPTGLDYEEIDEARWIARVALGDGPWRVLR